MSDTGGFIDIINAFHLAVSHYYAFWWLFFLGSCNDEVDYGGGEGADNETDGGVKDCIFGFFGFAGVASRGHVLEAAVNYDNGCKDT